MSVVFSLSSTSDNTAGRHVPGMSAANRRAQQRRALSTHVSSGLPPRTVSHVVVPRLGEFGEPQREVEVPVPARTPAPRQVPAPAREPQPAHDPEPVPA